MPSIFCSNAAVFFATEDVDVVGSLGAFFLRTVGADWQSFFKRRHL
jgi:hypothetical protein